MQWRLWGRAHSDQLQWEGGGLFLATNTIGPSGRLANKTSLVSSFISCIFLLEGSAGNRVLWRERLWQTRWQARWHIVVLYCLVIWAINYKPGATLLLYFNIKPGGTLLNYISISISKRSSGNQLQARWHSRPDTELEASDQPDSPSQVCTPMCSTMLTGFDKTLARSPRILQQRCHPS